MARMKKPSDQIERLSRAVHPGLMDAAIDPDLMIVLILANLMSDRLWQIRDRIVERVPNQNQIERVSPHSQITQEMLSFIDHHFTHDFPMGTAERVGTLDLQDERDRLGAQAVDKIKEQLWRHVTRRRSDGLLTPALDIFPVLEQDRLPIYTYSTIDGLHAMSRLLKRKKHRPLGLTVCADEATLTTSLASILHGISLADAFIVGSPGHYTTLLQKNGQRFWCNGKPEYFDQARWHSLTHGPNAADQFAEFDRRVPYADRFISMFGTLILGGGISTNPEDELKRFETDCTDFFGFQLPPFQTLHEQETRFATSRATRAQLLQLDNLSGAEQVRNVMAELAQGYDQSVFDQAFYCYRDIIVGAPGAYLANALRGPKLRKLATSVDSFETALEHVGRISGQVSIFGDRDRVAVADEVLLFDSGDDVDRGLLLLALLLASAGIDDADKTSMRLTVTDKGSFLTTRNRVIDVANGSEAPTVAGAVWMTLDQAALQVS